MLHDVRVRHADRSTRESARTLTGDQLTSEESIARLAARQGDSACTLSAAAATTVVVVEEEGIRAACWRGCGRNNGRIADAEEGTVGAQGVKNGWMG